MNPELVNIAQACAVAGVSRRTIYNWIGSKKIEFTRTAGGSVRIYRDSLFRDTRPVDHPSTTARLRREAEAR